MRSLTRRWGPGALVVFFGLLFAVTEIAIGQLVAGLVVGLLLILFGSAISPAIFPRSEGWEVARRRAERTGAPVVLWKPGCSWCIRLRFALGLRGNRAVWVDIWDDPDAAAQARRHNDGNETTPTMIVGNAGWTNPEPSLVRQKLPSRPGRGN